MTTEPNTEAAVKLLPAPTEGAATKPAKTKRVIKTSEKKAAAPATKVEKPAVKALKGSTAAPKDQQAKAPMVHVHRVAGVDTSKYGGASDMINANRKTKIMTNKAMAVGALSDRMKVSLYALRKAYGNTAFQARGFDNGVLRDLLATGLIVTSGGSIAHENGTPYLMDLPGKPVMVTFTRAGMVYGLPQPTK